MGSIAIHVALDSVSLCILMRNAFQIKRLSDDSVYFLIKRVILIVFTMGLAHRLAIHASPVLDIHPCIPSTCMMEINPLTCC